MKQPVNEPIAIVGSACRFAGSASSPSKLWGLLSQPRDLREEIPDSRFNHAGVYHHDGTYHGHSNIMHGYFLKEDPAAFDAEFFNIRPAEARAMDPQQRLLLEVAFEGLEAAGMSVPELRGSDTAVYAGVMGDDYANMILEDIHDAPVYSVTGAARSMLSNRLSYSFDWHGPSVSVDTACSSSLVAVQMALQALRAGDCRVALACGTNLILGPESFIVESKLGMLSPHGRCYMWDQRANGYARGDGIAVLVLKTLQHALEDNDSIECIIREIGLNQDGATAGITMPSSAAQMALIQDTYDKAGLNLSQLRDRPQFFEAHGTGTPAGDPVEAEAIYNVFGQGQPKDHQPLYVGSVKTVFGHTEGTAGIAAVLKASLALQNSCIPPNLLFETLSDRVAPFYKHIKIASEALPWPETGKGPRRASVNSFGFGGSNAHAILESLDPPAEETAPEGPLFTPLVFSAASETSLIAALGDYSVFLDTTSKDVNIHNLAWTLRQRRSTLTWRATFTAPTCESLSSKISARLQDLKTNVAVRALTGTQPRIVGIFTGQGAQYVRMGAELIQTSRVAREIMETLNSHLKDLPSRLLPELSLIGEMSAESASRINEAAVSQPLCTAVQILLVDLLRISGVELQVVVGHSSGEIAAAYAAGFLTARDAMVVSYYRGVHVSDARSPNGSSIPGAMLAVETTLDDATELCDLESFRGRMVVAAVNAPSNVTLSGDADAISEVELILQEEGKFHRRLRIDRAYHSPHMLPCSDGYVASLRRAGVSPMAHARDGCTWVSSVHNGVVDPSGSDLSGPYWAQNLTGQVMFSQAVATALATQPCDLVLEIGPHPALKAPLTAVMLANLPKPLPLHGTLKRGESSVEAMASALGFLWTYLGPSRVNLDRYERTLRDGSDRYTLLKALPTYHWNHKTRHWHESRTSRKLRGRTAQVHPLLGHGSVDSMPHHLCWKHRLHVKHLSWLADHRVQGQVVFPASGYISTAVEAARYMGEATRPGLPVQHITLLKFAIHRPVVFNDQDKSIEVAIALTNVTDNRTHDWLEADFTYSASVPVEQTEDLRLVASCHVKLQFGQADHALFPIRKPEPPHMLSVDHDHWYTSLDGLGYGFDGRFRSIASMRRKHGRSSSVVPGFPDEKEDGLLIAPPELDACLQAILLAFGYPNDGRLTVLHLPTAMDEMIFNPAALEAEPRASSCLVDATVTQRSLGQPEIVGHADLTRESSKHMSIRICQAVFTPLGGAPVIGNKRLFSKWELVFSEPNGPAAAAKVSQENGVTLGLLERIAIFYLRSFDRQLPENHRARSQHPTDSYLRFAHHITKIVESGRHGSFSPSWLNDTQEDVLAASKPFSGCPEVQIIHLVGATMPSVFAGQGTMLEGFRRDESNILHRYYHNAMGLRQSAQWVAGIVGQVAQRYRHMKILEIGAGTGAATRAIFEEIGSSFSTYTYTDISAAFFDEASSAFSQQKRRMAFKTLNIENDPTEQGFAEGSYDLIICFIVLHATSDITRSLRNARKLLKPGGYLVVGEGQDAWEGIATFGFIFGPLPGWWVGAKEGRVLSPYVKVEDWNKHLYQSGFSGVDTALPWNLQQSFSVYSFVTQAVDDYVSFLREPTRAGESCKWPRIPVIQRLVVIGGNSTRTRDITSHLRDILASQINVVQYLSYRTILEIDFQVVDAGSTVLCLTELDSPVFQDLTEAKFIALKRLLETGKTLVWVTSADEVSSSMMRGLGRVAVNESPDLRLQQVEFADVDAATPQLLANMLLRFYATAFKTSNTLWSTEPEIAVRGGHHLLARLEPVQELNDRYNSDQQLISRPFDFQTSDLPVCLENYRGSYQLVKRMADDTYAGRLDSNDDRKGLIELRTRYSTASALKTPVGYLFVVLATSCETGEDFFALLAVAAVPNCFTSPKHLLVPRSEYADLTDPASLTAVSAHLVAASILGTCDGGQAIMMHNPPGIMARAAALQAAEKGVEVLFTTDRSESEESDLSLIQVPRYFAPSDVDDMPLTRELSLFIGFSAVNTQAWDNEGALKRCLGVDCHESLTAEALHRPAASRAHLTGTIDALGSAVAAVRQISTHGLAPFSKVTRLEGIIGTDTPRELLDIVDWTVPLSLPITVSRLDRAPRFGSYGTYWVVGMSRALGISLIDWLIGSGVKNVVITSRDPEVSPDWVLAHKRRGVKVVILPCDIMDVRKLQSVHTQIVCTLPPIKGVIQGAMVLHDTLLRNMTFEQFRHVMGPKVDGSIYLDRIFFNVDLDFFVLVSSINCVVGNPGQANYAAANTFMCGLAAQRRKRGFRSAAVNIGAIIGAGYVARQPLKEQDDIVSRNYLLRQSEEDWCQAISEAIEACRKDYPHGPELTTGLCEVSIGAAHAPNAPNWCTNPIFSSFITAESTEVDSNQKEAVLGLSDQLQKCRSEQEARQVAQAAFAAYLRVLLQTSASDENIMATPGNNMGLDSLVSVDIRSWFLKHLRVNVPVLKIMGNSSMASLVQHALENLPLELQNGFRGLSGDSEPPEIPDRSIQERSKQTRGTGSGPPAEVAPLIDWEAESAPPSGLADIIINTKARPVLYPPRTIILTGCTGLLGHHILSHLLSFPNVERVVCVAVRSLPFRLKQQLLLQDARVSYFGGDLTEPLLGLSDEQARDVFASADAVIHNAADVSHLKHYSDVRTANLGSTVALARLCLPRLVPLHYISSAGLGLYHERGSTVGFPPGPVQVPVTKIPDGSFGYACSKWVCERFLERMSAEYSMRVFIHRPSTIIREGEDTIGSTADKDWINALLIFIRKLKAVPAIERKGDSALDLVDVRNVCASISTQLFAVEEEANLGGRITYVNEVNDKVIPLADLANLDLASKGESYAVIPPTDWISEAVSAGLHPGVAALINDMAERKEEYPKLVKGVITINA